MEHHARVDTPDRTPLLSIVLGYGPALLLPLLALGAWLDLPYAAALAQLWGAAILIFLAGVARGLSFFTAGGPRLSQLTAMLLRFLLGLAALVAPPVIAFALLIAGYGSIARYDPVAARGGGAPRYFARLRPSQMAVALIGLVALFARAASA